jgi:hypothetical protein
MLPVVSALAVPALLLGLGACSGGILMQSSSDALFTPGVASTFAYAAADRDMTTVIVGNPFQLSKDTVERAVTDAMQGNHFGPRTRFTTTPGPDARGRFRIVMLFDGPVAIPDDRLCEDPAALPPPAPRDRIQLVTAFCAGDDMMSWVQAFAPRGASPDDPVFRSMVRSSMWQLIPPADTQSDRTIEN